MQYATGGIFVYGPEVARIPGTSKLVAATNDLDIVKYGVFDGSPFTITGVNDPVNWSVDRTLPAAEGDNSDTALNSGPNGLYLTYRYFVPNDNRVGLRRFDPATDTFGAATYVEGPDGIDNDSLDYPDSFQDPTGRIHVVWRSLYDGQRLRYTVSDASGGSFTPDCQPRQAGEHLRSDARGRRRRQGIRSLDAGNHRQHPDRRARPAAGAGDDSAAWRRGHDSAARRRDRADRGSDVLVQRPRQLGDRDHHRRPSAHPGARHDQAARGRQRRRGVQGQGQARREEEAQDARQAQGGAQAQAREVPFRQDDLHRAQQGRELDAAAAEGPVPGQCGAQGRPDDQDPGDPEVVAAQAHGGRDGAPSRLPRGRYPLCGHVRGDRPMAVTTPITLDRQRIQELIEREERRLNERTGGSGEMYQRANQVLSAGVASSYQLRDPWPIYLERGVGPKVWDVDGNEMWDFHNGFGAMVQGHAHPAIGKAIAGALRLGTHFAAPTEDAVVVAEELPAAGTCRSWRYTNSGSESTMDAIRIARAYTGRETIIKISAPTTATTTP